MSYAESLARTAQAVGITPGSTSYFSEPSETLDPRLFQEQVLRDWVRKGVLDILFEHLVEHFDRPELWTTAWLAGSGVSYQWAAAREPGDLDCLVGVDYPTFRRTNPDYARLSDLEISQIFNEGFSDELMPLTANWNGYELTYYVNPSTDIRDINPYAAYDLTHNSWTVEPDITPAPPYSRAWEQSAHRDYEQSVEFVNRYSNALDSVRRATNPAHRLNAESQLKMAVEQASLLFDDIHAGRKIAFSRTGGGYADYNNYRWQAGKRSGAVQALRRISDYGKEAREASHAETYGVELPDSSVLIRRAATRR
jgi:hypothetical protein